MTRLAPHVLKPLEPCPGCLDMIAAWVRRWLTRLLFAFFWFAVGYGCHAWTVGR